MIRLNVTRNESAPDNGDDANNVYNFNGERMGPTLIVNVSSYVVVDVFNYLNTSNTSVHWHGMHQWNTGYMDGVAYITQEPTRPSQTFRLV